MRAVLPQVPERGPLPRLGGGIPIEPDAAQGELEVTELAIARIAQQAALLAGRVVMVAGD